MLFQPGESLALARLLCPKRRITSDQPSMVTDKRETLRSPDQQAAHAGRYTHNLKKLQKVFSNRASGRDRFLTSAIAYPPFSCRNGSHPKDSAEATRAHIGTPLLCHTVPSNFNHPNHFQGLIARVMPYRARDAMYNEVFAALRAAKIMHPFRKPGMCT